MCRLLSLPPETGKDEAIKILQHFEKANNDGTGMVYIKDGKFVVEKYPKTFSWVLREHPDFLSHFK